MKKKIRSFNDSDTKKTQISTNQNKWRVNMVNLTFVNPKTQKGDSQRTRSPLSSDMRTPTKLNSRYVNCFSPKIRNNYKLDGIRKDLPSVVLSNENKEFTLPKIKAVQELKTSGKAKELAVTPSFSFSSDIVTKFGRRKFTRDFRNNAKVLLQLKSNLS